MKSLHLNDNWVCMYRVIICLENGEWWHQIIHRLGAYHFWFEPHLIWAIRIGSRIRHIWSYRAMTQKYWLLVIQTWKKFLEFHRIRFSQYGVSKNVYNIFTWGDFVCIPLSASFSEKSIFFLVLGHDRNYIFLVADVPVLHLVTLTNKLIFLL